MSPVLKNGSGPFLERYSTPSPARDADGSLLLLCAAKDVTACRTFVFRLRAPALGWRDLLGPVLTAREAVCAGVGTQAERDSSIAVPSMGDGYSSTPPLRAGASGRITTAPKATVSERSRGLGLAF